LIWSIIARCLLSVASRVMLAHLGRILCMAIVLGAAPLSGTSADLTASVAALSDFRFRGVSLSDRQPALQAGLDWSHASGAMAGVLASTVRLGPADHKDSGVAGQAYVGWSGAWTQTLTWGGGAAFYAFPRQPKLGSLDYSELFLRVGAEDLQLGVYGSDSYFGSGAPSAYLAVSAGRDLRDRLRLFAHVGWLWTGAAEPGYYFYDRTRRFDASLGAQLDLRWVSVELSIVGATTSDNGCDANHNACQPSVIFALKKVF
jgi:uncharacterized protein (TIGR02001 family)